jgi:hypothetical protein
VETFDVDGDGDTDAIGQECTFSRLAWWELGYRDSGTLESSCLYLDGDPGEVSLLTWNSTEPPGASVAFQARACDSPEPSSMGAWSDTLFQPGGIQGILGPGDSYFQYRVLFTREPQAEPPVLEDVSLLWIPQGTGEADPAGTVLHPVYPNPSAAPELRFRIDDPSAVELVVFGLAGRIVSRHSWDLLAPGTYSVQVEDLSAGIYLCRMTSAGFAATRRFVVID